MGKILSSKYIENKILLEIEVNPEELLAIRGNYDEIFLFCDKYYEQKISISSRGKNYSTKYFLIPRSIKKNIDFSRDIGSNIFSLNDKIIMICRLYKK